MNETVGSMMNETINEAPGATVVGVMALMWITLMLASPILAML